MIVIEKQKLRFLLAGHPLTITGINTTRYRRGRTYALGITHKHSICRVEIIELQPTSETMRVRLANIDPPRLLAARSEYGYTDDPAKAMNGEPEAVPYHDLERYTEQAQEQHADRRQQRPLDEQIRELEQKASTATRKPSGIYS